MSDTVIAMRSGKLELQGFSAFKVAVQVNPEMVEWLETAGLRFVGKDETGRRMEILELPGHPYYVGVQFHPEFKSRPGKPSAVFLGLILAASGQMDSYISGSPSRNPPPPTGAQADSVSSQAVSVSERLEKLSMSNTGVR